MYAIKLKSVRNVVLVGNEVLYACFAFLSHILATCLLFSSLCWSLPHSPSMTLPFLQSLRINQLIGTNEAPTFSSCGRKMRSEKEKEKTKLRERERRAITTNIFRGLRKHGNYPLPPRADINQVLRHLAADAGWVVDPDGTTYRPSTTTTIIHLNGSSCCPLCGSTRTSANTTPTSSVVVNNWRGGGGDGECSKPLSPQNPSLRDTTVAANVNISNQQLQFASSMVDSVNRGFPIADNKSSKSLV